MKDYLTGTEAKDAEQAEEHESQGNGDSKPDDQIANPTTAEESDSSEDEVQSLSLTPELTGS